MTRIIRIREVMDRTGLAKSSLWDRVHNHEFPAPLRLGGEHRRTVGWRESDVEAWIERLEEYDN